MRWCTELSNLTGSGTSILDAAFPEELDVPEEQQSELFLTALRCFLEGGKPAAKLKSWKLAAVDIAQLRDELTRSSLRTLLS
jgi:hypothetical protein